MCNQSPGKKRGMGQKQYFKKIIDNNFSKLIISIKPLLQEAYESKVASSKKTTLR
jgi:hypothetical protein